MPHEDTPAHGLVIRLDDFEETQVSTAPSLDVVTDNVHEIASRVVVIAHPDATMLGRSFDVLTGAPVIIGRSSEVEVSLSDFPAVSRRHARITRDGEDTFVEDLGSRNGTFLNSVKINGRALLRHGDQIAVDTVHFRFVGASPIESSFHDAIYDLVVLDDLTRIFNRRKYEEEAEREVSRAIRHQRALSLVVFDVDDFKGINDVYGHPAGDAILRQLAALISGFIRREALFARVGGDEFVLVCPEVNVTGARVMAERLRSSIEVHPFAYGERQIHVTCSFGAAQLTPEVHTPQALYAAADARLYAAKQRGRNSVA